MIKKKEITEKKEDIKIVRRVKQKKSRAGLVGFVFALIVGIILHLVYGNYLLSGIAFLSVLILLIIYKFFSVRLEKSARVRKIEEIFPDFLQLMSSNLRAGMTIDKAMLISSRPEFSPLDEEIVKTGRDITTGKNIELSLKEMSERIGSEKIGKTILLIISGIRAGGNIAVLLEETAVNMRERNFVEKRAASNVMMYAIFIFIAVGVGAPALFSLSSVLVEILSKLLGSLPDTGNAAANLPFTLSKINVSVSFIIYFSIIFISLIDILASLILGLVLKGEEKEGLKYLMPLLALSIGIFFAMRIFLLRFLAGLF